MIKKIFAAIGILIFLIIASIIIFPLLFKGKIIQMVKDEANKNLNARINFGDFDISLIRNFPNFSFSIQDLSVVGTAPFEGDTLASIKQFSLSVDLMSVIKGKQSDIRSIEIDQPRIFAKVLPDGKANWDIAKEGTPAPSPDSYRDPDGVEPAAIPEKSSPPAVSEAEPSAFKIELKKFSITNALLVYDDRQGNIYSSIAGLDFTLKGDMTQDLTTLETKTAIRELICALDGVKYLNRAKIDVAANIQADMKNSKYTFKENEFKINGLELGMDGFVAMPKEDIDMDLKFFARKTDFKELLSLVPAVYMRDFEKVKTAGKLSLEGTAKGTYRDSILPSFSLKLIVENAMFQYPDLPSSVENINLNVDVSNPGGSEDNTMIHVNKFHFELAKNPVDIKLFLSHPVSDPVIDGKIKCHLDLNKVKEVIPLEAGDKLSGIIDADLALKGNVSWLENEQYERFHAAGRLLISALNYASKSLPQEIQIYKMDVDFSPQYVNLNHFEAKMGESEFIATGKLENFIAYALKDDAVLKGTCNLKSRRINLNQLMTEEEPAPAGASPTTTTATAAATGTAPMSAIEIPKNIDFTLDAAVEYILYDKMEINHATGMMKIKNQKVSMDNMKLSMLEGTILMNGSYATSTPDHPEIDFLLDIKDFDIKKTFLTFNAAAKIAPVGKYCLGKFSSNMNVTGRLDNKMEAELNTLNGGGGISTKNVKVENFEPINKVADALGNPKLKKMQVSDVNLTFKFKDGRINVDPFDVKIGESKTTVSGSNGFDQTLKYIMKMEIPTSELGSTANTILNNLSAGMNKFGVNSGVSKTVKVDIEISGTMEKPIVSLGKFDAFGGEKGIKDQAKDAIENKAKEETDKLKKEAEERARQEADRLKQEAENKVRQEADKLKQEAENKAKQEADRLKKEAEERAKKEAANKLKNLFGKPK